MEPSGTFFWMAMAAALALGSVVGSFLNVCIHRIPEGLSIVRPRSACPRCGRPIAWYDNLPVVSYLLLGGRCRACRAPISPRYPVVEAVTAALFALLLLVRGPNAVVFAQAAFAAALVALIVIDAQHQILPNVITIPGIVVGLLQSPLYGRYIADPPLTPLESLRESFMAAALGYSIPWAVNAAYRGWQAVRGVPSAERQDGIGQGDFKLLAMIGAFLGTRMVFFCLFTGAMTGAAFGVYMMWFRGFGWKSKLPFGVFLGAAAIVALFVGEPSVAWYLRRIGVAP